MTRALLTLNAGSSSIKCALYRMDEYGNAQPTAHAMIEDIDTVPVFHVRDVQGHELLRKQWKAPPPPFGVLLEQVMHWAETHLGTDTLTAVGHRVVHGGERFTAPERVTPAVLDALDALDALAPLHMPHNLAPIRAIRASRPALPQVACFDTAFHRTLPPSARNFALPREYTSDGIRRYGFHGLSFEYIAGRLRDSAPALAGGRTIVAHLGNGASLCALYEGRSIETTMGFSVLDGLVMGTRCGSLDPGVVLHLMQRRGMTSAEVEDLLYRHSGLLGVSGLSADMRELLASSDPRAREAIELYVYRIVREIGALAGILGGLDGLVFTAGIGEHAATIRAMVCERLQWLGAKLEPQANAAHSECIATPDSRLDIRVIPTDEETMIARHTLAVLRESLAGRADRPGTESRDSRAK